MKQSSSPSTSQSYHKAYAAAVVAVLLYVVSGVATGDWADVNSIAPALAIILMPLIVWAVPNREVEK